MPPSRAVADACPGALRLHQAADGPLARMRVPGGILTAAQVAALRAIAECGDSHLELTSRGNLQLRAVHDADALAHLLRQAELFPSDTHETVRNIVASPMAGRDAHSALDVRPLVGELDRALCADPALANLPGRFLFALDDGRGDVAATADLAAAPHGDLVAILFAGLDLGVRVLPAEAVGTLIAAAHAFLAERGTAWRLAELPDGPRRIAARVGIDAGAEQPWPVTVARPIGVLPQVDGRYALATLVPLGRLDRSQLDAVSAAAWNGAVLTPWRGLVLPDLSPQAVADTRGRFAEVGLETEPGSRWQGITTCAGLPGCANALADVRTEAAAATQPAHETALPVHWVGCSRGCGSPTVPHVRVEATADGYLIDAALTTDVGAAITQARGVARV